MTFPWARVAELADAPDLGSGGEIHGGSSPLSCTAAQLESDCVGGCNLQDRTRSTCSAGWRFGSSRCEARRRRGQPLASPLSCTKVRLLEKSGATAVDGWTTGWERLTATAQTAQTFSSPESPVPVFRPVRLPSHHFAFTFPPPHSSALRSVSIVEVGQSDRATAAAPHSTPRAASADVSVLTVTGGEE